MAPPQGAKEITMAHRAPKINDTVKFTDQQQGILNVSFLIREKSISGDFG